MSAPASGDVRASVVATLARLPQAGEDHGWHEALGRTALDALTADGWLGVGLPTDLGGEGGDLTDAVEIVDGVSSVGWPSPIGDLLLITNWLLAECGIPSGAARAIVVPGAGRLDEDGRVSASVAQVPWATWAERLVVVAPVDGATDSAAVSVVDVSQARGRTGHALSGAPWSDVRLDAAPVLSTTVADRAPNDLMQLIRARGALARSVQALAALRRARDLTIDHVRNREQFGRSLTAFQAVQQHLANLAGEVAAAEAAVDDAVRRVGRSTSLPDDASLATARVRVGCASGEVALLAHQLHGAMGIAQEHELHRHTLALWSWREEFGTEHEWAGRLAASAIEAPDFWPWLLDEN